MDIEMINPWTQVKSYHGHFERSQTVDEMILLIRDSFIPAFVGLEKTLRSKLEEVKNDWE